MTDAEILHLAADAGLCTRKTVRMSGGPVVMFGPILAIKISPEQLQRFVSLVKAAGDNEKDDLLRQSLEVMEWAGYRGELVARIRQNLGSKA